MKLPAMLIAVASGATSIGCASSSSMPPTVSIRQVPPLECRLPCPPPPPTAMPREQWDAAVFLWGADCKALHDDCVGALK